MNVKSIPQVLVDSYSANRKAFRSSLKAAFTPLFMVETKSKNCKVAMKDTIEALKSSPLNPNAWVA